MPQQNIIYIYISLNDKNILFVMYFWNSSKYKTFSKIYNFFFNLICTNINMYSFFFLQLFII